LKNYKLPGSDRISAKLIQAGGEIHVLLSAIYKPINFLLNKEEGACYYTISQEG
jgi:hypothetical protein